MTDFIAFLKFRNQHHRVVLDPAQLAAMLTKFADEDRALAEEDINEYAKMRHQEDQP